MTTEKQAAPEEYTITGVSQRNDKKQGERIILETGYGCGPSFYVDRLADGTELTRQIISSFFDAKLEVARDTENPANVTRVTVRPAEKHCTIALHPWSATHPEPA